MQTEDPDYVYHGSPVSFGEAVPRENIRGTFSVDGSRVITFDKVSFHATPYKWIAVAYTFRHKFFESDGRKYQYTVGIDLKKYEQQATIYGAVSLEESLRELYKDGGYVMKFQRSSFHWEKGLGILEVITEEKTKALSIERIDDPVAELKRRGISFRFVDVTKSDAEDFVSLQ